MKDCRTCGETKPLDGFYAHPGTKDGRRPDCRQCQNEDAKKRRVAYKAAGLPQGDPRHGTENGYITYRCRCGPCAAAKSTARRYAKYQWSESLEARFQETTACESCGNEFSDTRVKVVDHCHTSGHVRGFLCHPCNAAIGLLQDSPAVTAAALEYLLRVGATG